MRRRRGFTLLEVLLGSLMFASSLIYLTVIWGFHSRTVGYARSRLVAYTIATLQLEQAITDGFNGSDVPPGDSSITTVLNGEPRTTSYHYVVTKTLYVPSTPPGSVPGGRMKMVQVTVTYADQFNLGGKGDITLRTSLAEI